MAGKFQSYREWQEEKRNAESAGQEAGGNTRFQTYAQWRQERQTPEERDRYYQASGMDSFRRDFSKYAAYDIVKDEANREWEQNIRNQRDYFTRYASHFTKEQLAAVNQELDLYESIVKDRSAYARVQPEIIRAQGQQTQDAQRVPTQQGQRGSAYDETGIRADTQAYKNPKTLSAMAANGDEKASERYQSLEKEYGNADSGRAQRENREKRMRELDEQLAVVQQNIQNVTRMVTGPLPDTEEGIKTANQLRAWNMQRDRLLAEKQALSQQEDVKTGVYAAQEKADSAMKRYKKAAMEYQSSKTTVKNIANGLVEMYKGSSMYDTLVEAKKQDENEAEKNGTTPTYDRLFKLLEQDGMTPEYIDRISGQWASMPYSQALSEAQEREKALSTQEKTLRTSAQRESDAWEYEVAKAYSDKDFAALSKPSEDAMPDGELGEAYYILMAEEPDGNLFEKSNKKFDLYNREVEIGGKKLRAQELRFMDDGEKKLFYYFCNSGNEDMAELWISSMSDALKYRTGEYIAEFNDYPVLRELYSLASSAAKGTEMLLYGAGSIFADIEAPDVTSDEYALASLSRRNKGTVAGFMVGAAQNIGNMAPSLAGYAINPAVGLSATFFNARGNAYVEAKRDGFTHGQAWIYSTLVGASEAGLEKVLGGMGGIAKGAVPEKVLNMFGEPKKLVWKLVRDYGVHASSELIEENLQNYLDPAFAMIAGMTDQYDAPGAEEFIETSVVTAITTLFFSAAQAPAKVRQEKINQAAGRWADAALRLGEDNPAYNEGVKLRKMLDSGENVSQEQMLNAFERAGDENATKVAKEADVDKIVEKAKAQLKDVKAGWFTWDTAIGDAESVTEVWEQSLMEAYESGDAQEVLKTAASAVKLAESAQINLDNAYKLTRISLDEHEEASREVQYVKDTASEVIENYRNGIWSTITPPEQQTQEETEQEQKTQFEQAYIDAGAPEDVAKTAGEVLDGIVSGEITSENISNKQIMELMADTGYGREAIAQTLGVEVTEEKTTSAMRRAVKKAIAQYENNMALQDAAGTQRAATAQTDTTEGVKNNGTEISDDSGERDAGMGSGEQDGAVEEGTGGQVESGKGKTEADILRDVKNDSRVQSAKEIGVSNGSEEKSVYVLTDEEIEQSAVWRSVKQKAESTGARAVLYAGDMMVYNESTGEYSKVEGIRQELENGEIVYYIKADRRIRNAEKIYKHEYFHELVSKNPEMWADLVTTLYEQYSEREIVAMADRYAEAFNGIYGQVTEDMTEEEAKEIAIRYLEEMFADAYADIQRARVKTSAAKRVLASQTDAVQRAEQAKRAMRDTRGAPDTKYSIAESLKDDLEAVYNNTFDRKSGEVKIGETSDFLAEEIGAKTLPNYMPANKAYSAMATEEKAAMDGKPIGDNYNYHGLGVKGLYELLERAETPVAAYASEPSETDGRFDRIVLVTDKEINDGVGVVVVEVDSIARGGRSQIKANKTITAYDKQAIISAVQRAYDNGRLLYINKKSGPVFNSGRKGSNCPTTISETVRKNNIQHFWENVNWAKYAKDNNSKVFTSGDSTNTAMADAMRKAGISERFKSENTDGRYSIEEDVAELDEAYARRMQDEDVPEGMAPADEEIEDYHELAKEQKMRRAEFAKESTLKSRIKASENAIAGQQAGKAALRSIGALSEAAEKKINQRVELIRETMQIDREALKKKQQERESEERQKKQEKQQQEIKDQKAKIATKELRQGLLNFFSVKAGKRAEIADQINSYADELIRSGTLTNESRRELFELLYANGEEVIRADKYRKNVRSAVKNGRIYVPDSVREEFGEAWDAIQKKAWESKIYFTNDKTDAGIDAWTKELASVFGEQFDGTKNLKTQLETILELAEEGKQESITIEEMMRRNSEEYGWSIEDQMDELERKVDRMLETFAEKADLEIRLRRESTKKLLEDQEYFRRKIETMRRERMENEARNQVLKRMERLQRYEKKASPEFKKMIQDAIKDIDTLARRFSPRGIEDIQGILDDYLKMKEDLGEGFITSNEIEERLQRLKKMHIDDMGIEEVRELGEALTGMITQIQNQNQLLSTARREKISIVAGRVQKEIEATKGRKPGGKLQSYMQSHLDAKRFFGMISGFAGGVTEELSQALSNAEERTRQFQMRAMRIFDGFMEDKKNQKWLKTAAGENAVWEKVDVKGSISNISGVERPVHEIEITPMMKISLLMHSRNDDNLRHIGYYIEDGEGGYELVGGGITIPNKKLYQKGKMKEAYAKGDVVVMPPEVVKRIAKSCTEQELEFAELLTKYFDGLAKDSINEVSLVLDGWERAAVQNYFPIQSDRAFIVTDNELIKQDASLTSRGFLKERTHKGQNPVYLMDATDVLLRSIDQVSKYYGMTLAIRDVNAVLNSTYYLTDKEKEKRNKRTGEKGLLKKTKEQEGWGSIEYGSVRKTLEEKWGANATEYINKLLADLQKSDRSSDALSGFLEMLRGNYARAVISFNPSSVLKQSSSYPVAMAYLDADSLLYGIAREHWKNAKEAVRNLEKYSAVYWYRNQGNATMELRDAMAKKQLGDGLPLGFGWTQKMDSAVTRRLLSACEYQVRKDMKLTPGTQEEIDEGTDAYWTEVAKLFNKVVLNTQSNTSMMERPEMTRANPSNISRFLTMFRTDAYQQYNLLVEAKGRLSYARNAVKTNDSVENRAMLKAARRFARKSVTGVIVGQTMVALITSLLSWARFRDKEYYDENGNFDWGSFFLSAGDDFAEGLAGLIMGGDMLWSAASAMARGDKWYGPEVSSLETITDLTNSVMNLWKEMKDGNYRGTVGVAHDIAVNAGTALGLPVGNIEKYLLSAAKWIAPEFAEKYENLWEEKTKASLSRESLRLIEEAVGQIMENRTDNTSDGAKEEIARLYKIGMTSAVPNAIPTKLSYTDEAGDNIEVSLSGPQREKYRNVWRETVSGTLNELIASEEYEKADDEGKASMIKRLYDYAGEIAKTAVEPNIELDKWVQQGENAVSYGIPLAEYICFRELLSDVDGKDKNRESVDGLKAQRSVDILEAMGWTDRQEENVYLDVIASDSAKKTEEALRKAGMTWEQANDIVTLVGKKKDRMTAISGMNIGENVKRSAMMVYASDKEKKLLQAAGVFGIKMAWYMEVINNADEDGNGSVSGEEARDYIFGMDMTVMEKAYLWQMITDGKEGKNNPFSTFAGEQFWFEAHKDDGQ